MQRVPFKLVDAFGADGMGIWFRSAVSLQEAMRAGGSGKTALAGGAGTMASCGLALWARTRAPVAVVAALRETSIVFAVLIALCFLRERVGGRRWPRPG